VLLIFIFLSLIGKLFETIASVTIFPLKIFFSSNQKVGGVGMAVEGAEDRLQSRNRLGVLALRYRAAALSYGYICLLPLLFRVQSIEH
jgi:hypothetical protein